MKLMKKSEIKEVVDKHWTSLYVENFLGSKHRHYLKAKTEKGVIDIGRVPYSIYRWFNLIPMDQQPGYINVSWFKFQNALKKVEPLKS